MGHESYERQEETRGPSDRNFGLVFATVFALIGSVPLIFGRGIHLWALIVAAGFALAAVVAPATLAPLNRVWLKFGLLLHKVVSPVVLGIMFFLVITPIGLFMRALGKDLLRLKVDKQAPSYWIERVPPGPTPDSLKDQF